MAEVIIKAHTQMRKGKKVAIKQYTRRVGVKGVHSPKKSSSPGEELSDKKEQKTDSSKAASSIIDEIKSRNKKPNMTPEQIAEWDKAAKKASMGQYTAKNTKKEKPFMTPKGTSPKNGKSPLSEKRVRGILENVEDKLAKFVEKYTGQKYKRKL